MAGLELLSANLTTLHMPTGVSPIAFRLFLDQLPVLHTLSLAAYATPRWLLAGLHLFSMLLHAMATGSTLATHLVRLHVPELPAFRLDVLLQTATGLKCLVMRHPTRPVQSRDRVFLTLAHIQAVYPDLDISASVALDGSV